MYVHRYQIHQCNSRACGFRFPVAEGSASGQECPKCGDRASLSTGPYNAHEVERGEVVPEGPEIEALLDNIRSIFNVGNMLRSADGAAITHMHLCGITPTPTNPKLAKTALWALEGGARSELLFAAADELRGPPVALVVGSEVSGVDPAILELCERVFCLPMQGVKTTLNVAVAFGIAVYFLRFAMAAEHRSWADR